MAVNADIAVRTACEFWASRFVNSRADKDDLKAVTLLVNDDQNGFTQRHLALGRIKKEMGIAR
ncbi:hypothetical protein EGK14_04245 [Erwinia sp. 198]|nr:hypothetical protein EGK14_04245 [Erwinia sp. 198]